MSVFKIALPGNDVKTAKLSDEVLDSNFASPKVSTVASPPHAGLISLNWQNTTPIALGTVKTLYSFAHGYTQIPTVLGVCSFDNGSLKISGLLAFGIGSLGEIIMDSDRTNINLRYVSLDLSSVTPIPPFLMRIRFYVFAERGGD